MLVGPLKRMIENLPDSACACAATYSNINQTFNEFKLPEGCTWYSCYALLNKLSQNCLKPSFVKFDPVVVL